MRPSVEERHVKKAAAIARSLSSASICPLVERGDRGREPGPKPFYCRPYVTRLCLSVCRSGPYYQTLLQSNAAQCWRLTHIWIHSNGGTCCFFFRWKKQKWVGVCVFVWSICTCGDIIWIDTLMGRGAVSLWGHLLWVNSGSRFTWKKMCVTKVKKGVGPGPIKRQYWWLRRWSFTSIRFRKYSIST